MLNIGIKYCNLLEKKLELKPFSDKSLTQAFRILLQVHRRDLCEFREIQELYIYRPEIKPVQYWKYIDLSINEAIQNDQSWVEESKSNCNLNRLSKPSKFTLPDWLVSNFQAFKYNKVINQPKILRSGRKSYNKSKPPTKTTQGTWKKLSSKQHFSKMRLETKKILKQKYPNDPNKKWDQDFCGFWNTIGCSNDKCKRQHVCPFCFDENHKAGECTQV